MTTPKKALTDRSLAALKPAPEGQRYVVGDALVPGFGIRVTSKSQPGSGTFVLVARWPGNPNPAPRRIGDYPMMPLAEAREIARRWRIDIQKGIDPKAAVETAAKAEAARRADTFELALDQFAEGHLATLRTGASVKAQILKATMPGWKGRALSSITDADVSDVVWRLVKAGTPIQANRVLAHLKKFFRWAKQRRKIAASPAADVERPSNEVERDRVLTDLEVAAVWRSCEAGGGALRAVQIMLLTGQRRGEVGGMRWDELDLTAGVWRLPASRTKAGRAHEVPLAPQAVALIKSIERFVDAEGNEAPFVFTTFGKASISGWGKLADRAAKHATAEFRKLAKDDEAEMPAWGFHDLRRTAASGMARLKVERLTISKILNHAEGGVTRLYDRFGYDDEKRDALVRWASYVERVAASPTSGVVPLRVAVPA